MNFRELLHSGGQDLIYLFAVILFIFGIKNLSKPKTARRGNFLSALGMLLAVGVTLFDPHIESFQLIILGLWASALLGTFIARTVPMTAMPQMVALLNGFGGISSFLVAFREFQSNAIDILQKGFIDYLTLMLSTLVGMVTFSGSLVAALKLQEWLPGRPILFPMQKTLNAILGLLTLLLFVLTYQSLVDMNLDLLAKEMAYRYYYLIGIIAFILGITLVIPIGGADMPVVVSLLNSYSGIAVAMTGFVLHNNALIVVGSLVGASGIILTNIMCKAMNRSLLNVLFGGFGATTVIPTQQAKGSVKNISPEEAALILDAAENVIIIPGYGMAVSQAQHMVKKLTDYLLQKGKKVSFAVHPVAGRMPGHMNVLLAEAGVEYDLLHDLEINDQFPQTDVSVVIGANDVVNPAAKENPNSPIYGMPVFDVEKSRTVLVLKRSLNPGFAGIENELFYKENTLMVFGDAKKTLEGFLAALQELES
ncbi:MAG: NAD(P)(+) transhydrogenase (Re/Si-specific) subunit beta [Leptospiraceae bacterium]|nr:NAD(P)(+) transhydrogenase (Re/Si-specific) subunit beta [Leptospiraceae bacterium]MDW8305697.1 NAD(P)(+) transhydrogenase (Re/Si-specific) subunit beta [Leptospiraceae bacterium]